MFFEPFLSNLKLNVQAGFHKGNFVFFYIYKVCKVSVYFHLHPPPRHTHTHTSCAALLTFPSLHSSLLFYLLRTHFVVFCPDCYFFTFSCSASRSQSQLEVTVWVSALNNALILVWFCMQNCIVYDTKGLTFCHPIHYF